MRKRLITALAVCAGALAVTGAAYAAVAVTISATMKPSKANKPAGNKVAVRSGMALILVWRQAPPREAWWKKEGPGMRAPNGGYCSAGWRDQNFARRVR